MLKLHFSSSRRNHFKNLCIAKNRMTGSLKQIIIILFALETHQRHWSNSPLSSVCHLEGWGKKGQCWIVNNNIHCRLLVAKYIVQWENYPLIAFFILITALCTVYWSLYLHEIPCHQDQPLHWPANLVINSALYAVIKGNENNIKTFTAIIASNNILWSLYNTNTKKWILWGCISHGCIQMSKWKLTMHVQCSIDYNRF